MSITPATSSVNGRSSPSAYTPPPPRATAVRYGEMPDHLEPLLSTGPTRLMQCAAAEQVAAIVEGLNDAIHPLRAFMREHYYRRGSEPNCACPFCTECPHVMGMLHIVEETLEMHMWYLDNTRPPSATEFAAYVEDRRADAEGESREESDASTVVKPR